MKNKFNFLFTFLTIISILMITVGCPNEVKQEEPEITVSDNTGDGISSDDDFADIYVVGFNDNWDGYKMTSEDGVNYTVTMKAQRNNPTQYGMKLYVNKDWEKQYVRKDVFTLTYKKLLYVEPNAETEFAQGKASELDERINARRNIDDNSKIYLKYFIQTDSDVTVRFNAQTMKVSVNYTPSSQERINTVLYSDVNPYFDCGQGRFKMTFDSTSDNSYIYTCSLTYHSESGNWDYSQAQLGFLITRESQQWSQTFFTESDIAVGTEMPLTYTDYTEPLSGIRGLIDGKTYIIRLNITVPESGIWSDSSLRILISSGDESSSSSSSSGDDSSSSSSSRDESSSSSSSSGDDSSSSSSSGDDSSSSSSSGNDSSSSSSSGDEFDKIFVLGLNNIWPVSFYDSANCPEMITTDGIHYSITTEAAAVNATPYGIKLADETGFGMQYIRKEAINLYDPVTQTNTVSIQYVDPGEEVELVKADVSEVDLYADNNTKIYLKERVEIGSEIVINFNLETMMVSVEYVGTGIGINDPDPTDVFERIFIVGLDLGDGSIWPDSDGPGACPEMTTDDGVHYAAVLTAGAANPTPYGMKFVNKLGWISQYCRADVLTLAYTYSPLYIDSDEEVLFTNIVGNTISDYPDDNSKIYIKERVAIGSEIVVHFNKDTMAVSVTYSGTGVGVNDFFVNEITLGFNSNIGNYALVLNEEDSSNDVYVFNCEFTYDPAADCWSPGQVPVGQLEFGVTEAIGTWQQKFTGGSLILGDDTQMIYLAGPNNSITGLTDGTAYKVTVTAIADETLLWSRCSVSCMITIAE